MIERELREQDLIQLDEWFSRMDKDGTVGRIDLNVLDRGLNYVWGEFEVAGNEEKKLAMYSNAESREGMDAVWGKERYKDFVGFCREWIKDFESITGNLELPKLGKFKRKNAGMKEFFHQLTAYAYGLIDFEEFALFTEVRLKNGRLWQEGKKELREKIKTPISEGEKKLIGSLPPGFVTDFWSFLKSAIEDDE